MKPEVHRKVTKGGPEGVDGTSLPAPVRQSWAVDWLALCQHVLLLGSVCLVAAASNS